MVPRRSRDHPQAPRRRRQRRPRRLHELLQEPLPQRTPPQPLRPGHHRRPQPRRMTGTPRNEAPFRKTHPCDGLKGLPDAVSAVWEKTIVQTCIVHLLRNSFKYASKRDWAQIAKDLRPVYTAASETDALDRFADFSGKWEKRYPAIIRLWENAWAEFVPFLAFDREIRTMICTTNAIESINARLRRAVNARGHFPTEQAALKCLYLAIMSLDPTGKGRKRWTNRWKAALNAFDITFDGRLSAGRN